MVEKIVLTSSPPAVARYIDEQEMEERMVDRYAKAPVLHQREAEQRHRAGRESRSNCELQSAHPHGSTYRELCIVCLPELPL